MWASCILIFQWKDRDWQPEQLKEVSIELDLVRVLIYKPNRQLSKIETSTVILSLVHLFMHLLSLCSWQQCSLFTCRRNTILLASCISFSSCSWWASSCSSQDRSSSCTSCPREGHSPQRETSSESKTVEMRQGSVLLKVIIVYCLALQLLMCSQPTWDTFLLCQLRSVILRFPQVLRLIMGCFFFWGVSGLGDNILLFGGVSRAGWAETETDGGHREEWVCLLLLPNEWQ